MYVGKQKILGRFFRLTPPRFSGASGEDAYEFWVSCEDRLYNLGLVETCCVDQITFKLYLAA